MPHDKSGNFHMNSQRAMGADKGALSHAMSSKSNAADNTHMPPERGVADEQQGGAHEALSKLHAEQGGKHMHFHQDEMGNYQSHHVGEDGRVQGPHEHADVEALKEHLHQFFNDESGEYGGSESAGPHIKDGY